MVTMVNEKDDTVNRPPGRGRKLRNQGSNPTGSQTMSFTPEYSGELDYMTGSTALHKRTRAKYEEHGAGYGDVHDCCRELGLNLKEPLS